MVSQWRNFPGNGEGVAQGGNLLLEGISMENGGQGHGREEKQAPGALLGSAGGRRDMDEGEA